MTLLGNELRKQFEEVEPMEFYKTIFPYGSLEEEGVYESGKYNAIAMQVFDDHVKRYTVNDGLDMIDYLQYNNNAFTIISPISYIGKTRKSINARYLYALCIEIDNLRYKKNADGTKKQVGLIDLLFQMSNNKLPTPTYIVSSGTGVHLYYVFDNAIPLYPNIVKSLADYKRDLTKNLWNKFVTFDYEENKIQYESLFQAFRMVGTITKKGERVEAFKVGDIVTIEYMNQFAKHKIDIKYKGSSVGLEQAKKKYPEWYQERIVNKKPKGSWICNENLYKWWFNKIKCENEEVQVGHRFYCLMCLSIYAIKCNIPQEQLEKDALSLLNEYDEMSKDSTNRFKRKDIIDALQIYEDKNYITYPINSIVNRSSIVITKNKRNGRKQKTHLKMMRSNLAILNEENGKPLQGRKSKEQIVKEWKENNPGKKKSDCIKETKLSKPTVYKWW